MECWQRRPIYTAFAGLLWLPAARLHIHATVRLEHHTLFFKQRSLLMPHWSGVPGAAHNAVARQGRRRITKHAADKTRVIRRSGKGGNLPIAQHSATRNGRDNGIYRHAKGFGRGQVGISKHCLWANGHPLPSLVASRAGAVCSYKNYFSSVSKKFATWRRRWLRVLPPYMLWLRLV